MFSPVKKLMQRFGSPMSREDYIAFNWLGSRDPDGELGGEEESGLPEDFQRDRLEENIKTDEEQ